MLQRKTMLHFGEHSGGHEHAHEHACHHEHSHADTPELSYEQTVALMSYMLEHNRSHADELHNIAHALEAQGKHEAATWSETRCTISGTATTSWRKPSGW